MCTDKYNIEEASEFRQPLTLLEEHADCFFYSSQQYIQCMAGGSWEEQMETNDAVPNSSPTTHVLVDFSPSTQGGDWILLFG